MVKFGLQKVHVNWQLQLEKFYPVPVIYPESLFQNWQMGGWGGGYLHK